MFGGTPIKNEKWDAIKNTIKANTLHRKKINFYIKKAKFIYIKGGKWLIYRGNDVCSGIIVEGTPTESYISTFLYPTFDGRDFMHIGLGNRVVYCSLQNDPYEECRSAINAYKNYVYNIRTSGDITSYIYNSNKRGPYALWVQYLCLVREELLDRAEDFYVKNKKFNLNEVDRIKFQEIHPYVISKDLIVIKSIFDKWREETDKFLIPSPNEYDAFIKNNDMFS